MAKMPPVSIIQSVPVTLSCKRSQVATSHATYFFATNVRMSRLTLSPNPIFPNLLGAIHTSHPTGLPFCYGGYKNYYLSETSGTSYRLSQYSCITFTGRFLGRAYNYCSTIPAHQNSGTSCHLLRLGNVLLFSQVGTRPLNDERGARGTPIELG